MSKAPKSKGGGAPFDGYKKRKYRRHSAPAAMRLHVGLDELIYGKLHKEKKLRRAKQKAKMEEELLDKRQVCKRKN